MKNFIHKANLPTSELVLLLLGCVAYCIATAWVSAQIGNPILPLIALLAVGFTLYRTLNVDEGFHFMLILTFTVYSGVAFLAVADAERRGDPFGALALILGGALLQTAGNLLADPPALTRKTGKDESAP